MASKNSKPNSEVRRNQEQKDLLRKLVKGEEREIMTRIMISILLKPKKKRSNVGWYATNTKSS